MFKVSKQVLSVLRTHPGRLYYFQCCHYRYPTPSTCTVWSLNNFGLYKDQNHFVHITYVPQFGRVSGTNNIRS